ncbi:MAG: DUF3592 domain-containing protein [Clostridia bacterium]|nr:DUF3592 domain-containing protein [Clostridia bacterium]
MNQRARARCTASTEGRVIRLRSRSLDFPTVVTVQYEAGGQSYELSESLKLKSSPVKLGFLPIGQRKTPRISARVGSAVRVSYNPEKPQEAYLPENTGRINC